MVERIAKRKLIWSGEHWIACIRESGEDNDSGKISLYRVRYSPAGSGIVAFVDICDDARFPAIITDNRAIAQFAVDTMIRGRGDHFDRDLPIFDGEMIHEGDTQKSPSWIISSKLREVVVTWTEINPPLMLNGPGPIFNKLAVTFSLLFFAGGTTISHEGTMVNGSPYVKDIWKRAIGESGSSCVFALAETTTLIE